MLLTQQVHIFLDTALQLRLLWAVAAWLEMNQTIRAVLGIRGEPKQPAVPAEGMFGRRLSDRSNNRAPRAIGSASLTCNVTDSGSILGVLEVVALASLPNY